MPKIQNKPEPFQIALKYHCWDKGGESIDPGDRWSEQTPREITWSPTTLHVQREENDIKDAEWISVDFDPKQHIGKLVTVVVVRYTDGDTFGTTSGCWAVAGAFVEYQKATELNSYIQSLTREYETKQNRSFTDTYDLLRKECQCSISWLGYFNRLEDVEIHQMILLN